MGREELLNAINNIGTCEDEGERINLLNSLRDDINEMCDENENLSAERDNLTTANESLRKCNTDLFLQLGNQKNNKETDLGLDDEGEPEPRKFENLFDEKGELK